MANYDAFEILKDMYDDGKWGFRRRIILKLEFIDINFSYGVYHLKNNSKSQYHLKLKVVGDKEQACVPGFIIRCDSNKYCIPKCWFFMEYCKNPKLKSVSDSPTTKYYSPTDRELDTYYNCIEKLKEYNKTNHSDFASWFLSYIEPKIKAKK